MRQGLGFRVSDTAGEERSRFFPLLRKDEADWGLGIMA